MSTNEGTRRAAIASLLVTILMIGALGLSLFAGAASAGNGNGKANGKGNGNGNQKTEGDQNTEAEQNTSGDQKSNPDPEPSPSRSADRGGECSAYDQNQGGPYDHDNCDGGAGDHGGSGNGKCAGCTGRSDDKYPKGQAANDHNNGYECDHNTGVGKGNPAHSQCRPKPPTTPPPSTPPPGQTTPPPTTPGPGETEPNILTPSPSDSVQGEIITNEEEPEEVLPSGPERRGEETLPFTGAAKGLLAIALLGGILVVAGALLARRKKVTP